jgi:hypothetical protein
MPDATTFAELFGGVFPTEPQVEIGVQYGPLGDDLTGTAVLADAAQLQILDTLALLGIEGTWAITRTFETATGDKIPGVRVSLVGVANKVSVSGSDGITRIKTDDGTYTLRTVVPVGYEDVPDSEVVISGADDVGVVVLVATAIEAPANPDKSALVILCLDEAGEPEPGVAIDLRIAVVPTGGQNVAYKGIKQTATSDANGVARLEATKGATYEYKRGKADVWQRVTIGSGSSTNVSSFIGSP